MIDLQNIIFRLHLLLWTTLNVLNMLLKMLIHNQLKKIVLKFSQKYSICYYR